MLACRRFQNVFKKVKGEHIPCATAREPPLADRDMISTEFPNYTFFFDIFLLHLTKLFAEQADPTQHMLFIQFSKSKVDKRKDIPDSHCDS